MSRIILTVSAIAAMAGLALAFPAASTSYIDWKTYKATGVNLGGWLVQESTIDTAWWTANCGTAPDEWTCCANLGAQCGPVLTRRYATWITTSDIDTLAANNVTILRIPTTYAAWVKVPGSQLYSGDQANYLKTIATYAVSKYNMHIILDIHSLPGGVNGMPFGEREGAFGWFQNATALSYSYQAVSAALSFISSSAFPSHFTLEPINEPVDNRDITAFGSPYALSDNNATYVANYIKGVLSRVQAINPSIPVMFQDGFKGEAYFSPSFPATANLVFDIHNYYFAGRGADSATAEKLICSDAKASAGDGKFPTFVGEWSVQTEVNNLYANRKKLLNTGLYAFSKYTHGSAYWTAKFTGTAIVAGQGTQADYWNFEKFISLGLVDAPSGAAYCP
ncbi:hypothetical protein LTR56_006708 [Elasticomyces elasticus]|nr:hypothetical protein LTR22_017719 [Elasticomyces elasticus]KAK3649809.1 hypothetical protein LTR56_006708 [Elasticomyces elasticus]KAK4913077.1 hypothetical protein LTR49_018543 [Elasticomyces elasticus]